MSEEKEEKESSRSALSQIVLIIKVIFFTLIFCFCFFIMTLIARPMVLWKPISNFLNKGVILKENLEYTPQTARDYVEAQIGVFGENEITLPEDVITAIARDGIKNLPNLTIDIENGAAKLYWQLDTTRKSAEVLGFVEVKLDENNTIEVSKVGTPRFTLPKSLSNSLFSTALGILAIEGDKDNKNNLIFELLQIEKSYSIQNIEFKENELKLTIDTKKALYD